MLKTKLDSQDYLKGIKEGDSKVIRAIYQKYHKAIVHLVETKQDTKEDANDVFQEGLVLLFQKSQQSDFQLVVLSAGLNMRTVEPCISKEEKLEALATLSLW